MTIAHDRAAAPGAGFIPSRRPNSPGTLAATGCARNGCRLPSPAMARSPVTSLAPTNMRSSSAFARAAAASPQPSYPKRGSMRSARRAWIRGTLISTRCSIANSGRRMPIPNPEPGLVISYAYLFAHETLQCGGGEQPACKAQATGDRAAVAFLGQVARVDGRRVVQAVRLGFDLAARGGRICQAPALRPRGLLERAGLAVFEAARRKRNLHIGVRLFLRHLDRGRAIHANPHADPHRVGSCHHSRLPNRRYRLSPPRVMPVKRRFQVRV
jgi:hypothetical protein